MNIYRRKIYHFKNIDIERIKKLRSAFIQTPYVHQTQIQIWKDNTTNINKLSLYTNSKFDTDHSLPTQNNITRITLERHYKCVRNIHGRHKARVVRPLAPIVAHPGFLLGDV